CSGAGAACGNRPPPRFGGDLERVRVDDDAGAARVEDAAGAAFALDEVDDAPHARDGFAGGGAEPADGAPVRADAGGRQELVEPLHLALPPHTFALLEPAVAGQAIGRVEQSRGHTGFRAVRVRRDGEADERHGWWGGRWVNGSS